MTGKETLIKVLESAESAIYWNSSDKGFIEKVADHLIANGITIPVRCKDCKHWCYEYDDVGLCVTDVPDIDGVQRLADDFCSYGERRTDEI